jgi:hypothetical protein
MFTNEELTGLGVAPEIAEKIIPLANEKKQLIESQFNTSIKNLHNFYESAAKETFGIEKLPNEKGSEYLKRAAAEKLKIVENDYVSKISDYEKQIAAGGGDYAEKFQKAQETIKSFQSKESELNAKIKETENSYQKQLRELKENFVLKSSFPAVDFSSFTNDKGYQNLLSVGYERQKETIMSEIRNDYTILENGMVVNNQSQIESKLADVINEKIKPFLPEKQQQTHGGGGSGGAAPTGSDVAKFGFVAVKGMDMGKALNDLRDHFNKQPESQGLDRPAKFELLQNELLKKIS